jgi:hypothetical protein
MNAKEYLKQISPNDSFGLRADLIATKTFENVIDIMELYAISKTKDMVRSNEQLKAISDLKEFAYEVCPLHREDDLEEIVGRL